MSAKQFKSDVLFYKESMSLVVSGNGNRSCRLTLLLSVSELTVLLGLIFSGEVERQRPVRPGVSHCWFEGDLVLRTEIHSKGHLRLAETREEGG